MITAHNFKDGVNSHFSLRSFLRSSLLSGLGSLSRKDPTPFLRCVFCHYVFDDQVALFEQQILALKRMGSFVDTETCLDMVEGRRAIDGSYFHLSFDDGFKNIVSHAAPLLKKHKVPALFFVPTSFIGAAYEKVADYCVRIAAYKNPIEMCSWDDLKRAMEMGFTIGSHTRTHARFADVSGVPEQLKDELSGSKEDIERHLGVACSAISWPFGRLSDADEVSVNAAKEAGYRACFGAFRGAVRTGGCDPHMIPRHHFEAQWPTSHLRYFVSGHKEAR